MQEALIAVLGTAGVFVGAFLTWKAARDVAERDAKRGAYAAFLTAVDLHGQTVIRNARRRRIVEPEQIPDATPANAALAGLTILGSAEIAERAQRMQQCLADLSGAAVMGKYESDRTEWTRLEQRYWALRGELIDCARAETGAPRLPKGFFTRERPPMR